MPGQTTSLKITSMKSQTAPGPTTRRPRARARFTLLTCCCLATLPALAAPDHVVLIGVDGLSPDGIRHAQTPHLDTLMREGAFSFHGRAVMPTSSSPNWASMIMGAGPEQHGITSNDWRPDKFEIAPTATGIGSRFPSMFDVLRQQRPQAVSACFHDWDGIRWLLEPKALDQIEDTDGPTNAVRQAVAFFTEKRPTLTFIHLDHVDHAGHAFGYEGTPEYHASVEVADRLIGETIAGLKSARMWDRTLLIVTSDHGGIGKGHGGATMAEIEIPWIVHGPGVARGHVIKSPINVYDTAATIVTALGLTMPDCWIARPVAEAFTNSMAPHSN
jgi:predicted AlkP superfamily pyrophosphatase or phosphodiesterase